MSTEARTICRALGIAIARAARSAARHCLPRGPRDVILIAAAFASLASCGGEGIHRIPAATHYADGYTDLDLISSLFAPRLYLNQSEPCKIIAVIPIFHPSRPLVAYHVFFDDDIILAGRGKFADHEIIWAEYDRVTMKIVDVLTLWHRTVIRTDACVMDARASGQHPKISVQWGQHGMLPLGWESLRVARPNLEIMMHYELARFVNRIPKASPKRPPVSFRGSYSDYIKFTEAVDAADYMKPGEAAAMERSAEYLRALVGKTFSIKKEWPDW